MSESQERGVRVLEPAVLQTLGEQLGDADGTMLDQIVAVYLAQGRTLVHRLRAAAEASDEFALREAAHSLRGSTLAVGGARLAAVCERIEVTDRLVEAQDAARSVPQEFQALADQLAGRASSTHPTELSDSS